MRKKFASLDNFAKNILIVFAGSSLVNVINLAFQLYIAHSLQPEDFAAFNALIAVLMIVSAPLNTLQVAVTKFCSEWNAVAQRAKAAAFLKDLLFKGSILAVLTAVLSVFFAPQVTRVLKIDAPAAGVSLGMVLATTWLIPIVQGGLQGLELFGWLSAVSIAGGVLKFACAAGFITAGYRVAGALGALLAANLLSIAMAFIPLRRFMARADAVERVEYAKLFRYLVPVIVCNVSFAALVSMDMIMVQRYFPQSESGIYSLAQMVGKIFLFLPGAVSMVMFPRASGMNARESCTRSLARRSLKYVSYMSFTALAVYNIMPELIMKLLTGKVFPESVFLGRMFSLSMSFYTVVFLLTSYFLSIGDMRFLKFIVAGVIIQGGLIVLMHASLVQVQVIVCAVSCALCIVHLVLMRRQSLPGGGNR